MEPIRRAVETLLTPSFFEDFFGRKPLHTTFPEGDQLLTWPELTELVASDRYNRDIKLRNRHGEIPAEIFVKQGAIDLGEMIDHFNQGFSMTVFEIHSFKTRLRYLRNYFAEKCTARSRIGVFASGGSQDGLPIHFDRYDIFVIQLSGAKNWCLYENPRQQEMESPDVKSYQDHIQAAEENGAPSPFYKEEFLKIKENVIWQDTLTPGDVLYMPRGTFHKVHCLGKPSLHLIVEVVPYTWKDYLDFVVDRHLFSEADFEERIDLRNPQTAQKRARDQWQKLKRAFEDEAHFASFEKHVRGLFHTTAHQSLEDYFYNLGGHTDLTWSGVHLSDLQHNARDDRLVFMANGKKHEFFDQVADAVDILKFFQNHGHCSLDRLSEAFPSIDREEMAQFVQYLIHNNLVYLKSQSIRPLENSLPN